MALHPDCTSFEKTGLLSVEAEENRTLQSHEEVIPKIIQESESEAIPAFSEYTSALPISHVESAHCADCNENVSRLWVSEYKFSENVEHWYKDPSLHLYCAKFFQCLGDRMWIYSGPLLLLSLRPDTLTLPALYGFITGISAIIFGPLFGEWVDAKPRMHAAIVTTIMQNGFLAMAALLLGFAVFMRNQMEEINLMLCVAGLILFSFVANIFYGTSLVIIEKDWVAVIAGDDSSKLARMIAAIRRIELIVQVLCPLAMAQLLTYCGTGVTAVTIGGWSLATMSVEYAFLRQAWRLSPTMKEKGPAPGPKPGERTESDTVLMVKKVFRTCYSIHNGWTMFRRNKVGTAALAICLLEANVIVFNGVTCGFAATQGFSNTVISLLVAGDALAGVVSTFIFPLFRRQCSLTRIGLWAASILCLTHAVCVVSNWLPGSPFDLYKALDNSHYPPEVIAVTNDTEYYNIGLAVMGVEEEIVSPLPTSTTELLIHNPLTAMIVFSSFLTVGRFAYGLMDLTGSQLLLENTSEEDRGAVCAVQYSIKQIFVRLTYLAAILLPWPHTFGLLVILSFCSTFMCLVLFLYFSWRCGQKDER
ncbi:solute carrier family 40 member 1-like [Paramacrobiotus metropolitanus]|uniref:solute carrier family 40 member 1-like n=1 Tax=Paramacrobiotus metropolitanus TaxID=2943436 RepID=UPI002445D063|nr:solute carrier family 40 member 1-like [Paramacrobiotus metropolitanus]